MAYNRVAEEHVNILENRLKKCTSLVERYRKTRDHYDAVVKEYKRASNEYDAARKEVADELLTLYGDISRVEQHHKGETW